MAIFYWRYSLFCRTDHKSPAFFHKLLYFTQAPTTATGTCGPWVFFRTASTTSISSPLLQKKPYHLPIDLPCRQKNTHGRALAIFSFFAPLTPPRYMAPGLQVCVIRLYSWSRREVKVMNTFASQRCCF